MRLFITLLLAISALNADAQLARKELRTDSGLVVLHHFKGGGVSTSEWTDKDGRWGRSLAYDPGGTVIFERGTRRVGGNASVRFSYHPNGAVSKADVSDAPDGGIQWYKSTTTFDPEGNETGFNEYGRDNYGPIPQLDLRITTEPEPHVTVPPKQEEAICQRMFQSELFVVNPTNSAVRVVATAKEPSPGLPGGTWTMAPGDTVRIGIFSKGEAWPAWERMVELNIEQVVLGDRNKAVARTRTDERFPSTESRQLHVVIEEWISDDGTDVLDTPKASPEDPEKKVRKRFRLRLR